MSQSPAPVETPSCHECLTEIPSSVATSVEADEYVYYFCGLDCYDKWRERDTPANPPLDK